MHRASGGLTYDLASGRPFTRDPIGSDHAFDDPERFNATNLNLYAYAGNNPQSMVDPSGNDPISLGVGACLLGGGEAAGAAAGAAVALPFVAIAAGGLAIKAGIDAYFANLAAEQGTIHWQEETPAVPDTPFTDGTGKVHGDENLPDAVPDGWTGDDVGHAIDELINSIGRRNEEQRRLGEDGPHRERIRREEEFLRKLRKRQGDMGCP